MLCLFMLRDVLNAVKISKYVERVIVISCDQRVLEFAKKSRVLDFNEGTQKGLNSAIKQVTSVCKDKGAESILILPVDIPLVKTEDIDNIIRESYKPKSIVITPSLDEKGTNALLIKPPTAIKPSFGLNSFQVHIDEAKSKNIPYTICRLPRIALDLDTPKDIATFLKIGDGTETYNYMVKIGLINRVRKFKDPSKPILRE